MLPPDADADAVDPRIVRPPTFGRVPRAASMPWRLTLEPAASGIAADQAQLGDLDVRAASIVGPGHRCEDPAVARQDSYRLGRDKAGRYLIVAVADGMSDSRRSDLGAMVASRCAVDTVRGAINHGIPPDENMLHNAFRRSAAAMVTAARNSELTTNDVRCALIVAIVPAFPESRFGNRAAWFASLADVSAWVHAGTSWAQVAGDRKTDDMDRNLVRHFLPHQPDAVSICRQMLPADATITVVTDGVGDAFTDVAGADAWFADRWRAPVPLESFLLDVGYHASGQLDDRTAVTVWCRS
ncbi:MAG: protein phosphatase 2C domain-containing protein [Labedaea sp.]